MCPTLWFGAYSLQITQRNNSVIHSSCLDNAISVEFLIVETAYDVVFDFGTHVFGSFGARVSYLGVWMIGPSQNPLQHQIHTYVAGL